MGIMLVFLVFQKLKRSCTFLKICFVRFSFLLRTVVFFFFFFGFPTLWAGLIPPSSNRSCREKRDGSCSRKEKRPGVCRALAGSLQGRSEQEEEKKKKQQKAAVAGKCRGAGSKLDAGGVAAMAVAWVNLQGRMERSETLIFSTGHVEITLRHVGIGITTWPDEWGDGLWAV